MPASWHGRRTRRGARFKGVTFTENTKLADLSGYVPLIMMMGIMIISIFSGIFFLKKYYVKAEAGEVLILNNLESNFKVVRNGTIVMPIIHSVFRLSLKTQVVSIDQEILEKINELYGLTLKNFVLNVEDKDQSILKAFQRTNIGNVDTELKVQLKALLENSIQELLLTNIDYDNFKNGLSKKLNEVGYEFSI